MKDLIQRDAMKVVSSHFTAHRSRNKPSNVRDGDCRDGEKLLCKTWYGDIIIYLQTNNFRSEFTKDAYRCIRHQSQPYCIVGDTLH